MGQFVRSFHVINFPNLLSALCGGVLTTRYNALYGGRVSVIYFNCASDTTEVRRKGNMVPGRGWNTYRLNCIRTPSLNYVLLSRKTWNRLVFCQDIYRFHWNNYRALFRNCCTSTCNMICTETPPSALLTAVEISTKMVIFDKQLFILIQYLVARCP